MTPADMHYALSEEGIRDTKAFLHRSREIENELALMHARMDQWRKRKALLSADGPSCREKEELLSVMAQTEAAILNAYHALIQVEKNVEKLIFRLPERNHRMVLELYYLHHLSFLSVAEKMHMDERHVYRVFKKALEMASLHRVEGKEA